jgi:hypothetical protein
MGSRAVVDLPLFPGHVFAPFCRDERVHAKIPGVVSILRTTRHPAPLPGDELRTLRKGLDSMRIGSHSLLQFGQNDRIKAGALGGIEGPVVRRKGRNRVVLTLDLPKKIAIEVSGDEGESIDASHPLTLNTDRATKQRQRAPLYRFTCFCSYPGRPEVKLSKMRTPPGPIEGCSPLLNREAATS